MAHYSYEPQGKPRRERKGTDGQTSAFVFRLADGAEMLSSMQTTIRVRFSDRTQLEKTFSSSDKIRSVYALVRSSLRDDVKPIKFILCS